MPPHRDRWAGLRRWLGESPGQWLPGALFGAVAGGCAAAWVLWGAVNILGGPICFPMNLLAAAFLYVLACVGGFSFIASVQHVVRAIRHLRQPAVFAYYEPPSEKFPELELIGGPPGCGLVIYIPIVLLSMAISVPWFWIGPASVPLGRLLLTILIGLPAGLLLARAEHRREVRRQQE
jgi:hypothetical protein